MYVIYCTLSMPHNILLACETLYFSVIVYKLSDLILNKKKIPVKLEKESHIFVFLSVLILSFICVYSGPLEEP